MAPLPAHLVCGAATLAGARGRYGDTLPPDVTRQIEKELSLIDELDYCGYFLTMYEIVEFCRAKGATILSLTGHANTPLADMADHAFVNFAEDDTSCESFYLQSMTIALTLMHLRDEYAGFASHMAELRELPPMLALVKDQFDERAAAYAAKIENEPYHLITAAGNCWAEAWYFGMESGRSRYTPPGR